MNAETKEVFISIATQIDTKSRHTTVCFICVTIECCGLSSNNERLYKHPKSLIPNRLRWSGVNSVSKLDLLSSTPVDDVQRFSWHSSQTCGKKISHEVGDLITLLVNITSAKHGWLHQIPRPRTHLRFIIAQRFYLHIAVRWRTDDVMTISNKNRFIDEWRMASHFLQGFAWFQTVYFYGLVKGRAENLTKQSGNNQRI